jgi:hypothetical protein
MNIVNIVKQFFARGWLSIIGLRDSYKDSQSISSNLL